MGEWPTLFHTPAKFLDHLLFTIGNGYDLDELTNSFIIGGHFIHEFPIFDREKMREERLPFFIDDAKRSLRFKKELSERIDKEYTEEQLKKDVDDKVALHVYPYILPHDLTVKSLYEQIKNDENNSDRLKTIRLECNIIKNHDSPYRYVRPYPLSENYSDVFELNKNSPKSLLTVAHNFCVAWSNYLKDELESGNYYKVDDGRGLYSTKEQTEIIKNKIDLAIKNIATML